MKQYMFLINMRYADSLVFYLDVDSTVAGCYVPKLIIQPLLENAVKHGIEPIGEGSITLRCYGKEDKLAIEVEDNGKGMSKYELDRIRDVIDLETRHMDAQRNKRRSIGFQNAARRVQLIYGKEAEVRVYSKEEAGTRITILLPLVFNLDEKGNLNMAGD